MEFSQHVRRRSLPAAGGDAAISVSVVEMSDELQLATSMIWPLALASKPRLMSAKAEVSSFVEPTHGKRAQSVTLQRRNPVKAEIDERRSTLAQ
jgi:hypothetical protein